MMSNHRRVASRKKEIPIGSSYSSCRRSVSPRHGPKRLDLQRRDTTAPGETHETGQTVADGIKPALRLIHIRPLATNLLVQGGGRNNGALLPLRFKHQCLVNRA